MKDQMQIEIDSAGDLAYIRLRGGQVARTIELTDDVLLDLDEMNIVLGVEVLTLSATIPFGRLVDEYHVHSETVDLMRQVQPSVAGFLMSITSAAAGEVSPAGQRLVPA